MSEQQRCVDVISKCQKRKQKTIILGITFFIVFIFMVVLSENNNTGFIFGITFLILLISLIWFVALIIKNIIDRIKNGSDMFLYIKLNEEGRELLRQQENKSKEDKSGKENYGYFRHSDYGRRTCAVPVRYERNGTGP